MTRETAGRVLFLAGMAAAAIVCGLIGRALFYALPQWWQALQTLTLK